MATWQHPGKRHKLVVPLMVLAALGVEAAVIGTQLGNGTSFDHIRWSWLAIAGLAEVVSVLSLGALYRPLLRAGGIAVPRGHALALGSAASAITATLPAGTAIASGYLFRQFRRGGGSPGLAGWAVSVGAALSLIGFATVVAAGSSIGADGTMDSLWRVGGVGLAVAVVFIAASMMLLRRPAALRRLLGPAYRRIPARKTNRPAREAKLSAMVDQLTAIRPSLRILATAFAFAVLTWASDLAVFLLSLHAVGVSRVAFDSAVIAYAAGLATVSISIIPAGIGTVEAGMLVALTSAGARGPMALAGVVLYRVIAYVLVAAAGWLVWATLRRRDRTPGVAASGAS